jgi:hypothetical protein
MIFLSLARLIQIAIELLQGSKEHREGCLLCCHFEAGVHLE